MYGIECPVLVPDPLVADGIDGNGTGDDVLGAVAKTGDDGPSAMLIVDCNP